MLYFLRIARKHIPLPAFTLQIPTAACIFPWLSIHIPQIPCLVAFTLPCINSLSLHTFPCAPELINVQYTTFYLLNHWHHHRQISEEIKQAWYKHFTQIGISSLLSGNICLKFKILIIILGQVCQQMLPNKSSFSRGLQINKDLAGLNFFSPRFTDC